MKTYVHRKTCTQTFLAALYIIVQKYEQLKYLLTDETENVIYPYNGVILGYNKEVLKHATWIDLKNITLNGGGQSHKTIKSHHSIHTKCSEQRNL